MDQAQTPLNATLREAGFAGKRWVQKLLRIRLLNLEMTWGGYQCALRVVRKSSRTSKAVKR
jgi:hypothetical protein